MIENGIAFLRPSFLWISVRCRRNIFAQDLISFRIKPNKASLVKLVHYFTIVHMCFVNKHAVVQMEGLYAEVAFQRTQATQAVVI